MKFLNKIDGADKVVTDSSNRFVTDTEKNTWSGKADKTELLKITVGTTQPTSGWWFKEIT